MKVMQIKNYNHVGLSQDSRRRNVRPTPGVNEEEANILTEESLSQAVNINSSPKIIRYVGQDWGERKCTLKIANFKIAKDRIMPQFEYQYMSLKNRITLPLINNRSSIEHKKMLLRRI